MGKKKGKKPREDIRIKMFKLISELELINKTEVKIQEQKKNVMAEFVKTLAEVSFFTDGEVTTLERMTKKNLARYVGDDEGLSDDFISNGVMH